MRTSAAGGIEAEQALTENDLVEPAGVLDLQTQVDYPIMIHEVPVAREHHRQPMRSHIDEPFVDWLAAQSGARDRRKQKIHQVSSDEPRRTSELLTRKQRVNPVPKEEVLRYLSDLYSRDDALFCQMRAEDETDCHRMPFRKKNGEMYRGKEELFNRQLTQELTRELPEDARLYLFLCPTCAAIYTEFIASQSRQQRKLMQWINGESGQTVFEVDCSLKGQQPRRFLHFNPKHLDDIRSVDGVSLVTNHDH